MMKRINYIILATIFWTSLLFNACTPDDYELGKVVSKEQLDYTITQNADDPNMVYLESLTPNATPLWITPSGKSTEIKDTVKIPFPGDYDFVYGVQSGGGFVQDDTVTISITTTNTDYVSDSLWTYLAGGIGKSKTWILDNGEYGLEAGPLSYADPSRDQVWDNYATNWDPTGEESGATEADYQAEMTFDLIGGANLTTVKPNETSGDEEGVYSLSVTDHTISTSDATIIRMADFIPNASNWTSNLNILELNRNQLRIAVLRTNDEGEWWYIFNYVSKDYAESYEPEFTADPNFDHGDQLDILAGNSTTTWKLSTETPFNWADLDGNLSNAWYSVSDYDDWAGFEESDISNFENARITFTKTGDVTITENNGDVESGYFDIVEKTNLITFTSITPNIFIAGDVYATTTDYYEDAAGNQITGENQWKIVKTKSVSGITTDVWFGKRNTTKDEYLVFHFVLEADVPDFTREVTKALCGGLTGETERTFKIDLDWPVDWRNPWGEGWTESGEQADWYWSDAIAATVDEQTLTFKQVDGVITATKVEEDGTTTSSSVEIDAENKKIVMNDIDIIEFGADSWLPTTGPDYYIMSFNFDEVEDDGIWLAVKNSDTEFVSYHYIVD